MRDIILMMLHCAADMLLDATCYDYSWVLLSQVPAAGMAQALRFWPPLPQV